MENKELYYKGPWHAFYSTKSIKSSKNIHILKKKKKKKIIKKIYTNFYRNNHNGKEIEITSVFSTKKYPNYQDCPYYFEDKIYLGIVNDWVRIGEYKIL